MIKEKLVALSFDVEEFDLPHEHGVRLSTAKQLEISNEGLNAVLDMLDGMGVKATFFCTAFYAENCPRMMKRIVSSGHEVASHAYNHSNFKPSDLAQSRLKLEEITGQKIKGYRAPRMAEVSDAELAVAGYEWDSSLNPCFLPGRYNNSKEPRTPFRTKSGLIEIPASVTPTLRLPLFWLSLHNMPLAIYKYLLKRTLNDTGLINVYFHPWEFSEHLHRPELKIPLIVKRNSGTILLRRLTNVIFALKESPEVKFVTLSQVTHKLVEKA